MSVNRRNYPGSLSLFGAQSATRVTGCDTGAHPLEQRNGSGSPSCGGALSVWEQRSALPGGSLTAYNERIMMRP